MVARKSYAAALLLAACGEGGNVARYAPCTTTDTCPSKTVCEAPTLTGTGAATVCTYSCKQDSDCPSDSAGVSGVCVPPQDVMGDQADGFGFCVQSCPTGSCPSHEMCTMTTSFASFGEGSIVSVCAPAASDLFSGATWESTSIPSTAISMGVTSSTYTMTFGGGAVVRSTSTETSWSGTFRATFTELYTIGQYAGCVETTTFTGGTWTDAWPPGDPSSGAVAISGATGITNRTGCQLPGADLINQTGIYDSAVDSMDGTSYTATLTTMTLAQSAGVTPYIDGSDWTFTKM
jgi:hypothetical protein